MNTHYKSINVLIVTYKQSDVIGRNIESILKQKEYGLNQIVICDDCSPDNNWEVIQSYVKRYPGYITAYRNERNLGIYGNSNKLVTLRGEADFYCWLEGDDALCDGFFRGVQEAIIENQIDASQRVGIFTDYLSTGPDGMVTRTYNGYLSECAKPFGAYLRNLVSWRASVFSSAVISQFRPVDLSMGLGPAETLFDSQWFRFVDKTYYKPVCGSIYYSGIGVSVDLRENSKYATDEARVLWRYLIESVLFDPEDIFWAKSRLVSCKRADVKLSDLIKFCYLYVRGMKSYSKTLLHFRRFFGPLAKRVFPFLRRKSSVL